MKDFHGRKQSVNIALQGIGKTTLRILFTVLVTHIDAQQVQSGLVRGKEYLFSQLR